MRVLLLTAPMVQLNTPYPATPYLTGFLRKWFHETGRPHSVVQADPALSLFLRLFSSKGVAHLAGEAANVANPEPHIATFVAGADRYIKAADCALRFLQGKDPTLAHRIAGRDFLPEGPRFAPLDAVGDSDDPRDDPLFTGFGNLGVTDCAKHLASLFIDDLADVIRDVLDPRFGLSRYGEKLAASAATFDEIARSLSAPPTYVDQTLAAIATELALEHKPSVVGITAPFPGNVIGAFQLARTFKRLDPRVTTILGGGYPNTELRQLAEPRVFDDFDFVTLDAGERCFVELIEFLERDRHEPEKLVRTYRRETTTSGDRVVFHTRASNDFRHAETGTPTYDGLPLSDYVSLLEMANPMHRLWSDGRWNKLTVAHGCYWKKCTFCDVSLDYISRYDVASADVLVDRIESLVAETGTTGFHFVDEAAPPAALRALAERLLERNVRISWWGNIRFEKTFTPKLAELLSRSGCIALTGGLEVASDRLLSLMKKGVTVEQVARVTRAFTDAGIMVHAYLMYGFPTETTQETVDALERVRQLFEQRCIQSAFWHRFAATVHSPIFASPKRYGIRILKDDELPTSSIRFARNEVSFVDPTETDHDALGEGLRRALYNYMHGNGIDLDVRHWFAPGHGRRYSVPKPTVPRDLVRTALNP